MPITLLIVDDSPHLLETWKYILSLDPRFSVVGTCTRGEEAIEAAQKLCPDIVIMDHDMPGMTGVEATALICKSVPDTKVLGFSLHTEPQYARKFMNAGASGYMEKSANVEKMADTLLGIYYNDSRTGAKD